MKVYVMTKAVPLGAEEYVGVRSSRKNAEKAFKEMFPFMRYKGDTLISDSKMSYLLFIHEEEIN